MDRLSEYVINHSSCHFPRCEYVENGIEIDCDKCQEIMIQEHNKQIRTDTINECIEMVKSHSDDDKLMNNWYVELLEQLKGE